MFLAYIITCLMFALNQLEQLKVVAFAKKTRVTFEWFSIAALQVCILLCQICIINLRAIFVLLNKPARERKSKDKQTKFVYLADMHVHLSCSTWYKVGLCLARAITLREQSSYVEDAQHLYLKLYKFYSKIVRGTRNSLNARHTMFPQRAYKASWAISL